MVVKTNKKTKFDFLTLQKEDLRREIIFNYKIKRVENAEEWI